VASLDPTIWIPIIGTWVLVVGTLAFAYWQLRQNQRLHSASTLLDLRERYFSQRMRQARRVLSTWLLERKASVEPQNWEVAVFFELLGSLTRTRVLDERLVRTSFGTWITGYYLMITRPTNLFAEWRTESNDPLIFADFEWLALRTIEFERHRAPAAGFDASIMDEARYVVEGDSHLDTSL